MSARYLLRLDDACPTMDGAKWARIERLFDELGIKPIVAVTPDNIDPQLHYQAPDRDFWARARGWQERGWTIAMHGYQHQLREFFGKQYLPFYNQSEFAGLSVDDQAEKIRAGWAILLDRGLTPTVWIAPAHSFDRATLLALAQETPIRMVSDGIARDQYVADGFHWLPQQLWSFAPRWSGLWTVCIHPSTMSDADFDTLEVQLRVRFRARICAVDDVARTEGRYSLADRGEAVKFWARHYFWRAANWGRRVAQP